jgi:hypothetical protein
MLLSIASSIPAVEAPSAPPPGQESLPSSTSNSVLPAPGMSTITSFFAPSSRKPNETAALAFLERFKVEGAIVVDWVDAAAEIETVEAELCAYHASVQDLLEFTDEDQQLAVEMEELHGELLDKKAASEQAKKYVRASKEAFRFAEVKQAEMASLGKAVERLRFITMKNKAKKVLDLAHPILQKEQMLSSFTKNPVADSRASGGDATISPLSQGGVSCGRTNHNNPISVADSNSPREQEQSTVVPGLSSTLASQNRNGRGSTTSNPINDTSVVDLTTTTTTTIDTTMTSADADNPIDLVHDDESTNHPTTSINQHHQKFLVPAPLHATCRQRKPRLVFRKGESSKHKKNSTVVKKHVLDNAKFMKCEENGFRVLGKLTYPGVQGYSLSAGTLFCGPCGCAISWDSRHKHTLSGKHVARLVKWDEGVKKEQLRLTHMKEWQEVNNLQGQTLSEHCRMFRLDAMRVACQGNIPAGAMVKIQDFLRKYSGHQMGGERGLTDNIPFLW